MRESHFVTFIGEWLIHEWVSWFKLGERKKVEKTKITLVIVKKWYFNQGSNREYDLG